MASFCAADSLERLIFDDAALLVKFESVKESLSIFIPPQQRASLIKECNNLKNQKEQLDAKRAVLEADVCESENPSPENV